MRNACTGAVENVGSDATYHKEIRITKKLFNGIKDDLVSLYIHKKIFKERHWRNFSPLKINRLEGVRAFTTLVCP